MSLASVFALKSKYVVPMKIHVVIARNSGVQKRSPVSSLVSGDVGEDAVDVVSR